MSVAVRRGGHGSRAILLLHGLGATADVWRGVAGEIEARGLGRWVAPDLPGHGASDPLPGYSFDALAGAVAEATAGDGPVFAIGHSLGGVVALALASGRFGVQTTGAVGVGIKVRWSDDDLARARALADKPNPDFGTRDEAAERFLKLAGLVGRWRVDEVPDGALLARGGRWRVRFDPRAFAVGAPDLPALLAAARVPVTLAAGERDPMGPPGHLAELVASPIALPGLGHNAHVESPAAILSLIEPELR